ncbi:MAG: peptidase M13 [Acidobacteria bacterium RIFCSPLOWO2_12_FULL_67_14b]|nr:MAG: peptidase M13 [Acidobacteria bacterium RIFCSPLOWO2_12_FULL_67_14b]
MHSPIRIALALLLLGTTLTAQGSTRAAAPPTPQLPYTPSLDPTAMDRTADPCGDFYQFACGGWMKNNPIPPDQSSWTTYGKMQDDNRALLRALLEQVAPGTAGRTPNQQKIGDYYGACMAEETLERRGASALAPQMEAIAKIASIADLAAVVADSHRRMVVLGPILFSLRAEQDAKNSTETVAGIDQSGLGLPDRDYYLKDDAAAAALRAQYGEHVSRVFQLLGDTPAVAAAGAQTVLRIETALATGQMSRVDRRNPDNTYHRLPRARLAALMPSWPWDAYFRQMGIAQIADLNVAAPGYFAALERQLTSVPLGDWKAYVRWHTARLASPYLSSAFVDADFAFFSQTLAGAQQLQPRWKRCVGRVDRHLGEALGRVYVEQYFTADTRARTLRMVRQIEAAMEDDINTLEWMSSETRTQALEKLRGVTNKIGHPERWRDYSSVRITADDFFGDARNAMAFEVSRQLTKIGKPLIRGEWYLSPPTVNANYDPQMNEINFPAGVLQPPAFDPRMDDAPNYGNTGGTIGHELTHGFDDEGRLFDARGNRRDWWTLADGAEFERRAGCISDQYSSYVAVGDVRVNGKLTLGENVADLGGLILAYRAWIVETTGKNPPAKDGLSPVQRFFVGYAQSWCANTRPETLRMRAITDPHAPERHRANGVVSNMPEFARAFACRAGQPMVREPACKVW